MKVFVMGATGATGRHLVQQLLERGLEVTAVVRSIKKLLKVLDTRQPPPGLEMIEGSVLKMNPSVLSEFLSECDAAVSCLGHNLSFKGIYGRPHYLVTKSVRKVCETVAAQNRNDSVPFRFILMNTSGNLNPDEQEHRGAGEAVLTGLIRVLLPPHRDNENAADYLRTGIGRDHSVIEWTAVRPDSLINSDYVTEYLLYPSPVRSPLFNPGRTSRINAANFMVRLAADIELWEKWKGRMPVIYNEEKQGDLVG